VHDVFKGFLLLRLLGLLVLLLVVAAVLGVLALTRGSYGVGAAILAGVAVVATGIGCLVARRASERRR
jgi:hypothetical protein